ncbi:MAG: AAA family ATPase [Blastocatellia bacterium]
MAQTPRPALLFPPFHIPGHVDLLYRGQALVSLERRAVQVLRFLAEHHDRVVTRDELLENIWPDTFTTDGVLKRAVSQARRALGDVAEESKFIETYHGRGYRFIGRVIAAAPETNGAAPDKVASTETIAEDGLGNATRNFPAVTPPPGPLAQPVPRGHLPRVADDNQLVGRDGEMAALQAEYRRAVEGTARPVILVGEPGIGKTQLARTFRQWAAEQGAQCLYGRFFDYQASRLAPYEALLDMLRALLCAEPERKDSCDLRALVRAQFNVTLPEELFIESSEARSTGALALPAAAGLRSTGPLSTGQLAMRHGTGQLAQHASRAVVPISQCFLRASQRQPLVLVLDDIQWADEASRDVLGHMMRTLQNEPLLIVCLARADALNDREHSLSAWLKRQAGYRSYSTLGLKPLDVEACGQAVGAIFHGATDKLVVPPQDLRQLHRVTGGNPYFLTEMLRLLAAEKVITWAAEPRPQWHWHGISHLHLPDSLVLAAGAKLDRLSEPVREMAEAAAVLGDEFRVDVLARMTARPESDIDEWLEEAVRRGVMSDRAVSAGNDARFDHGILRHTLYEALARRRRKRLHLQAAMAIETTHANEIERFADALSAHYEAGGDPHGAFEWGLRAWQAASARWQWGEATPGIERARRAAEDLDRMEETRLPATDRMTLLFALGETWYSTGKLRESETAWADAIAIATRLNDRGALAVALLQYCNPLMGLSRYPEATVAAGRAMDLYRDNGDQEGVALALAQLGGIEVRQGNYDKAVTLAQQALEGVALNSQIAALSFGLLGWARALQGHYTEGVPLLERAVDYMSGVGDVQRRALLLRRRHWADLSRGRYEAAIELAMRARDDFRGIGDARGEAQMNLGLGQARIAQGLYEEGIALLRETRESSRAVGDTHLEAEALWLLGRAQGEAGFPDTAETLLEQALGMIRGVGDRDDEFRVLTDQARVALARAEYETALDITREAQTIAQSLQNRDGLGAILIEQARALTGLQQHSQAMTVIEHAIALLNASESGERWRALSAQAGIFRACADTERALTALRRAVALLDEMRHEVEDGGRRLTITRTRQAPARALCDLLRASGQTEEANAVTAAWELA